MAMSSQPGKINFKPASDAKGGEAYVGHLKSKMAYDGNVNVTTLDTFFNSKGSFHGFMHQDVEGYEQDVIKCGIETITEHSPLFSYEVHLGTSLAQRTIKEVEKLGYVSYMINEVCGVSEGCRNLLAFPREGRVLSTSSILDLAILSKAIIFIDSINCDDVFMKYKENALAWGATIPALDDMAARHLLALLLGTLNAS